MCAFVISLGTCSSFALADERGAKSQSPYVSLSALSGFLAKVNSFAPNDFQITNDLLDYRGSNYVSTIHVDHNFGGRGMIGSRAGVDVSMIMRGTSSNTGNGSQYYVGIADYVSCSFNDNGSPGLSHVAGSCVGVNPIAELGGSDWYTLNAEEVDTVMSPSGSAAHVFGELSVKSGANNHGSYDDAAIAFASGDRHPTWSTILQIGKTDGSAPTDDATDFLRCVPNVSTAIRCRLHDGIDFSSFAFKGFPFLSPGFSVGPSGDVAAGTVSLTRLTALLSPVVSIKILHGGSYTSAPGVFVARPSGGAGSQASAAVAAMSLSQWERVSGGRGYRIGDRLSLAGNGACADLPEVTVVSVGLAGDIDVAKGLYGGSCSAMPTGTVAATGGHGMGATFTVKMYVSAVEITAGGGYKTVPDVLFGPSRSGTALGEARLGHAEPIRIDAGGGLVLNGGLDVSGPELHRGPVVFAGPEIVSTATNAAPLPTSITPKLGEPPGAAIEIRDTVFVAKRCSTAAPGQPAALLQLPAGATSGSMTLTVLNRSGTRCDVYPPHGGTIEALYINRPVTIANGADVTFRSISKTAWFE